MRQYKSLFTKVTASISIIGSGVLIHNLVNKEELKASWTNTYEPSIKWDFNWDRRDPISSVKRHRHHSSSLNQNNDLNKVNNNENNLNPNKSVDDFELNKQTSKATRHLFLIRHGQYEIKAPIAEQMILTALGREQAELTGKRLSELRNKFKFNKLHHSTMIRAIETAQLIHKQLNLSGLELPVSVDPLLCEGAPIPPEPPVGHWRPEQYQFFTDGSRIEAAFRKYFYRAPSEQLEDSYEIIVCHANVIRYFFCRALQFPAEAWLRFDLPHGSITHILIRPDGRVSCRGLGEAGFQPVSKLSS